ncbi:MAG: hypothetical protein ABI234_15045 [Ktedonobacteraceae bacterium]
MAKKQLRVLVLLLAALTFGSIVLMSCASPGTANSAPTATQAPACPGGDTVKTGVSTFEQSCIMLSKGGTLTISQDVSSYHSFDYGQWNGATQQPATPPNGAPALRALILSGPSVSIGPFTTAGTYNIFCTVHAGMNLTVIVK